MTVNYIFKTVFILQASEKAQRVKAPAAKTHNLSWIPGAHLVEGENQPLLVVLEPTQVHHGVRIHMCTHVTHMYTHVHIPEHMMTQKIK